jgi:hypothetical protein
MKLGSDFNKMKNFRRVSEMEPKMLSSDPEYHKREFASQILPEGATLADRPKKTANWWMGSTGFGGYGGSSMYHTQRPYMPEFDSPDRQWYPEDRCEANRYWRLFYKTDPMFGTAVEMYSTMMTSEYDIVLENTQDASVKKQLEDMCETVNLQKTLQDLVKEYLVLGEAIPHCFFSQQKGIWTHVGFHDPDYVEIIDSSMIDMEPMIYFVPPDELRELLTLSTPEAMELRRTLPVEFVSKVLARQKIRLSPLNCSFIPRKLHPYDERGVSLASRLWRINMVEDAVYNSTISTYRRSAAPLKVLKLGDPNTGWIPAPETEQKLLSMVTQAENDVQSWIVTNYGANFETWGNQDRAITLKMEYDTIEKVKLVALGMSKSFMSGEISFASARSGLQVFLRRLLSMRQFFEAAWIYPKFFNPIIEINDWNQRSTTAEVNHRIKVKRTAQEAADKGLLVTAKLKWKNRLDSAVDEDLLRAIGQLKQYGFDVSMSTIGSTVGMDWRDEQKKKAVEFIEKEDLLTETLGVTKKLKYEQQQQSGAKPPGAAGSGAVPPSGAAGAGGKAPAKKEPSTPPGNSEEMTPSNEAIEPPGSDSVGK